MKYNHILIRYAELALKGKNRREFEKKLQHNLKFVMREFPETTIVRSFGRMFIELNGADEEKVMERLQDVFGIHSYSPALKVELDQEKINETALWALKDALPEGSGTFKVSAKRVNKGYPLGSYELNQEIGAHLLRNTDQVTVDVHHPDVIVAVEIRDEAAYIMCKKYLGAGGLPIRTAGKVLLMLSGGIDSPVAGFLALKRGVELEAIHFQSPPFTNERALQKVKDLTKILTRYGGRIVLHIVPFTETQMAIHEQVPDNFEMTVTRRFMLRIAEAVAKKNEALAIVNGESLGQVASQTLKSMNTINDVTNFPVLRPLVTTDKSEVIDIAQKIGTYDISILPYEDCCTIFLPPQTKTKPNLEKTRNFEEKLDIQKYVDAAVDGVKTIYISRNTKVDQEFKEFL